MIRARRAVQIASLSLFVIFLLRTQYPLGGWRAVTDIYLRSSVFLAASVWLNAWRIANWFIPALVIVALTFVLGRFFCGWLCPLGATLDATDKLVAKKSRNDAHEPWHGKWFKYALLVAALVSAYFEANLAGWLDPISLMTRVFSQVAIPCFDFIVRLFRDGLYPVPGVRYVSEPLFRWMRFNVLTFKPQQYHGALAIFLLFLAVVLAGRINRRFWCRFLCPLGAIHALLSRFSIYKKTVDEKKCIACGKCERNCRMGAITSDGRNDYRGECVECFTCQAVCPTKAVSFRPVKRGSATEAVNLSRRGFLMSTGAGLAAAPLVRLDWEKEVRRDLPLVRPPGVWNEERFMQTCVRCGQCMRVCPTNCLQPEWFQNGVEGLWTPYIAARFAECVHSCNLCGQVCPSGAIAALKVEEKERTVIGTARFDHGRCIPWAEGRDCAVCEEHCPVPQKAIKLHRAKSDIGGAPVMRPAMHEDLCVGCGICESRCPVPGPSAIRVAGVPQYMRSAEANPSGSSDFNALYPAMLPWKPGKMQTYAGEKLFEYINGGADVYLEYGFDAVATREYLKGDNSIVADIYRMKDSQAAYGIFRNELAEGTKQLKAGQGGSISGTQGAFWKGRFYVKLSGFGSIGEKDIARFAAAIDARIRETGDAPNVVGLLPNKNAIVKNSERFIRGPLTMRNYIVMNKDVFAFKRGAEAAGCLLAFGSKNIRAVVVKFPSSNLRDASLADFSAFLSSSGYSARKDPDFDLLAAKSGAATAVRSVPGNALVIYPDINPADASLIRTQ